MDWASVDWAVVIATFFGPIFAVAVTLWHQGRSEKRQARQTVYGCMMRLRRHPLNPEFVGALNMVPIYFHKSKAVRESYREVMRMTEDAGWKNPETMGLTFERFQSAIGLLLSDMSKVVGTNISQLDILRGAYAPEQWATDETEMRELRRAALQVLYGHRNVPVDVRSPVDPAAPTQQQDI